MCSEDCEEGMREWFFGLVEDKTTRKLGQLYVRMGAMSENRRPLSVTVFLPAAIVLSLLGWAGMWYLMTRTSPTLWPRWLFFFFLVLAVTGSVLPLVAFLNRRFSAQAPFSFGIVVRESLWVGVWVAILVWLNKGDVLSLGLALVLGAGFLLGEVLLRVRHKSRWRPGND